MAGLGIRLLTDEDVSPRLAAELRLRGYYLLADAWARAGRQHAGIIMTSQSNDIGGLLRRVEWHLDNYEPAQQDNVVLWLAEPPPEP